jgi:putative PIN family toxin of toxin-antitoxin system
MRVILDTNVLISAMITPSRAADQVYKAWRAGSFDLVSCEEQLAELRRVTRRPSLRDDIRPADAGRAVNQIRRLAVMIRPVPRVSASPDPADDFVLAMAAKSRADYLVTGDKSGLLALQRFGRTRIVTIRRFLSELA